jgi:hypothetical protein
MRNSKALALVILVGTGMMALASRPVNAAILRLDPRGILQGADRVDVDGVLYDVSFAASSCDGVGTPSGGLTWDCPDLPFGDALSATAAGQALLDQVFVDGPAGLFDSNPTLTAGCGLFGDTDLCQVFIPYGVEDGALPDSVLLVASVSNTAPRNASPDGILTFPFEILTPTRLAVARTSAEFRLSVAASEPSMLLLLSAGWIGLALESRRRQARARTHRRGLPR